MISTTAAYWIVLIFGGVAVAVHAYQLFGTSLPGYHENDYSIISLTPVLSLGSPRGYLRGFLFYLAVTEVVFIILSTSSTILKMAYELEQVKDVVGPLTPKDDSELNPAFPIAASMVLVTLSTIKPFSDIEHAFRRIAHRLAGIPRSFFDVVTKIGRFDFLATKGRLSRPSETGRHLAERAKELALERGLDDSTVDDLESAILLIYSLEPWTLGRDGERIWTQQARHAFMSLTNVIKPKFESLDLKLRNLIAEAEASGGQPQSARDWELLEENADVLRSDIASILALFYLNEPAVEAPKTAPLMRDLLSHIRSEQQSPWLNLVAGTLILGLLGNMIMIYVVYIISDLITMRTSTETTSILQALPRSLLNTIINVIDYTTIFATAAVIALLVRSSKEEVGAWRRPDGREFPFANYAQLAVLSFVCTAVVFLAIRFIVEVILLPALTSQEVWLSPGLISGYGRSIPQYCFYAAAALPCAWYAALVADNFDQWPLRKLLTAGAACSTIVGLTAGAVHLLSRPNIEVHALLIDIIVPALIVSVYFGCLGLLAWRGETNKAAEP